MDEQYPIMAMKNICMNLQKFHINFGNLRLTRTEMSKEKVTCNCDDPNIYARHTYEGCELIKATASCKNCPAHWLFNLKTKKWERVDKTRIFLNT